MHCAPLLALCLAGLASATTRDILLGFRDIFATHCRRHNSSWTDEDIASYVLFPTDDLISAQEAKSIEEIDSMFLKHKPSDLQATGATVPFGRVDVLTPLMERQASGNPVTIFIIGGMMGETIPHMALGIGYNTHSNLAKAYSRLLKKTPIKETVYDLKGLDFVQKSLGELVLAGSVDLPNGTSLYNVVWLKQIEGSLESLNDISITVPTLMERMTKFLDLVGDLVKDFVVLGYSRGAVDAADIMAQAHSASWGKRLRGIVSLDGVNWGTSPDCTPRGSAICKAGQKQGEAMAMLVSGLVPENSAFKQNLDLIEKTFAMMAEAGKDVPPITELNGTKVVSPSLYRTWEELFKGVVIGMFDVMHPVSQYGTNVQRLIQLLRSLGSCGSMLDTSARIKWFKTNTLPEDRLYLAITATQHDAAYVAPSLYPDEYFLRNSYYSSIRSNGGMEMFDGQVATSRELWLPRFHAALNPQQRLYEAHWAGVFLTDHWADSLDYVIPTPDKWTAPFPRFALLDSIATWVSTHS